MNKTEIFNAFNGQISRTAIREAGGEYWVVGKYCYVAPQDGGWDVWICNTRDLTAGLGQRKVHNLCQAIFGRIKSGPQHKIVDGEAWGLVKTETVLLNAKILGIRRKRRQKATLSQAQIDALHKGRE